MTDFFELSENVLSPFLEPAHFFFNYLNSIWGGGGELTPKKGRGRVAPRGTFPTSFCATDMDLW